MGSNHPGGCNVAMVDGSARFISDKVDVAVLRAASGVCDAQVADLDDW